MNHTAGYVNRSCFCCSTPVDQGYPQFDVACDRAECAVLLDALQSQQHEQGSPYRRPPAEIREAAKVARAAGIVLTANCEQQVQVA